MTPLRWMWLSLVVALTTLALAWQSMPTGRIAVHFGVGGEADNWGTRNELCGVVGLITIALWAFLAWMTTHADRLHWSMVNIPRKDHWARPENEPVARARLAQDMAVTGVWTMLLFAAIMPPMALAVRRGEMGALLGWATIGIVVVWTVAFLLLVRRRQQFYRDVPEA